MNWLFQLHSTHPVAHAIQALAFATNMARSDVPTVAYATVYPLTMFLRILCAQVLALILIR